jgi:thiopeptide-type bacteriocin biosynthesis protein
METKHCFILGDEWLYYKIYCGVKTSDLVLIEVVKPLIEHLFKNNYIDKWFVIRYVDPHSHLRLRFHFSKSDNIIHIISYFNHLLKPFVEAGFIWKVALDTYNREIERYGKNSIALVEDLFFHDSNTTIKYLYLLEQDNIITERWHLGLVSIDCFLNDFNFNLIEKYFLIKALKESFGKEFGLDKSLKYQLKNKFNKESKAVNKVLKEHLSFVDIYGLFNERSSCNKQPIDEILSLSEQYKLSVPLNDIISSCIHMNINRLFRTRQRLHELVIYDFLYMFYKSELAKAGIKVNDEIEN